MRRYLPFFFLVGCGLFLCGLFLAPLLKGFLLEGRAPRPTSSFLSSFFGPSAPLFGTNLASLPLVPQFTLSCGHTGGTCQSGKLTAETLASKPSLLAFGYASCPDICPVTLRKFDQIIAGLGNDSPAYNFIFISLDPENDQVPELARYVASFHPAIQSGTGDKAQLDLVTGALFVNSTKDVMSGTIDHTSSMFLLDRTLKPQLKWSFETPADSILDDLKRVFESK